ncbi:MAG: hypothetical protein CFH22_00714 [Alphaproteobacteria bacterium MarineAlpha5_Bin12]|nr:hypothetical protein [Pelagibacteraceae bacterium]PPR41301.1 MAG: hypothetical protein CFH22_00714 [Alphaproteobacteria bacterium MarineAlpha5_Bin12]|tara:strand:- start:7742 stop:9046 length:1305 start_codon:yes stop_codon:yes gene_type:complete
MTEHDLESRRACDSILAKWKSSVPEWKNRFINNDIVYVSGTKNFPSPDRSFYSSSLKTRIAVEFKPYKRETKRGILTGIGQSIAYLKDNNNSASYLVVPEKIENFNMGIFLENIFKTKIFGKLPIGLVTFNIKDESKIKLRCNIANTLTPSKVTERGVEDNYWAAWRDSPPHATYLLLKIAFELKNNKNRSKAIWDNYFDNYFVPKETSATLDDVKNKVKMWDGSFQIPLSSTKKKLRSQVKNKDIEYSEAIQILKKRVAKNVVDNLYQDYKKNHFNYINHLKLWDHDTKFINPLGKSFLDAVNRGNNLTNEIAKITLVRGRHIEFIRDIETIKSNMSFIPDNHDDFRKLLDVELDKKGFMKRNPNRTTSGIRKLFQSELQLWDKFGIKKKHRGEHFVPGVGYLFDFKKINMLEKAYHNTYDKIEAVFLSDSLQ